VPSYTLSALQTKVLDLLDGNSAEFPLPNITAVLNHGLARMNLQLGLQSTTVAVPGNTVAGQFAYSVPSGIEVPVRCDFQSQEISPLSFGRLARSYPTWATDTSANLGPPARWARLDLQSFIIHPADAYGGALLEVTGIAPTTPLVNAGDVVGLEDQWAECLIAYSRMRLLLKEGGRAFAEAVKAFAPYKAKIREASIWRDVNWSQFDLAMKQKPGAQRMPL
jgi:hypothetical protein